MITRHWQFNFLCLLLVACGLLGCLASPQTTPVEGIPEHTPELSASVEVVNVTPTPLRTTPSPAASSTVTATMPSTNIQLTQVTQEFTEGTFWAADGRALVYATRERSGQVWTWWQYTVATGEHRPIDPPFQLNPRLWTQLEVYEREEMSAWSSGAFSPSGDYILYTRLPPGYTYTPTPDDFHLPPYAAWVARTDGSAAVKVQSDCLVTQALWLNQETQVIFICSTEGGWADILLANVDGDATSSLSQVFGGQYNNDRMALSPDETKLAFIDNHFGLRVAALDGSENIEVKTPCEFAFSPDWSPDNQRVYFRCQGFSDLDSGIYVYDLRTGTSTLFIASPLIATDGSQVNVAGGGNFRVSPRENAVTFRYYKGLWLITWTP